MTTPEQRTAAVLATRDFLKTLAEGKAYEVPGAVRALATGLLLGFPTEIEIIVSAAALPDIWATPGPSAEAS